MKRFFLLAVLCIMIFCVLCGCTGDILVLVNGEYVVVEYVAREGKLRADVRVGGDPNHYTGHAHIYDGSKDLASVDEFGKVLAGNLTAKAALFVERNYFRIAEGIRTLYYTK